MLNSRHIAAALTALFIATPIVAQDTTRVEQSREATNIVSQPAEAVVAPAAVSLATVPQVSLAPTRASVVAGVQLRMNDVAPAPMPVPAAGRNSGNVALMIVGGAGLIVGSIIDGDSGKIIMVSGAIVGLYGLWQYLK